MSAQKTFGILLGLAIACQPLRVVAFDPQGYVPPGATKPIVGGGTLAEPPSIKVGGVARGVAGAAMAVGGLKAAKFCSRHPLLCTGGVVAGLAVGGVAVHRMQQGQNQPLCPPPVPENESMPDFSRRYQQMITGMAPNTVIVIDGVKFDGCRQADGTLLEAKGRYAQFIDPNGVDLVHYLPGDPLLSQALRQASVARLHNRALEWYFAEERAADFWRLSLGTNPATSNIKVIFRPMR